MASNRAYGQGRSEPIQFRVSPDEKQQLDSEARSAGLNTSDYVRARLGLAATKTPTTATAAAAYAHTNALMGSGTASMSGTFNVDPAAMADINQRLASVEEAVGIGRRALKKPDAHDAPEE